MEPSRTAFCHSASALQKLWLRHAPFSRPGTMRRNGTSRRLRQNRFGKRGEARRSGVAGHPGTRLLPGCDSCADRSEEHTSELQSRGHLVCRLLLEKKKEVIESRHTLN